MSNIVKISDAPDQTIGEIILYQPDDTIRLEVMIEPSLKRIDGVYSCLSKSFTLYESDIRMIKSRPNFLHI